VHEGDAARSCRPACGLRHRPSERTGCISEGPSDNASQGETLTSDHRCPGNRQPAGRAPMEVAELVAQARQDAIEQIRAEIEVWKTDGLMGVWQLRQALAHLPGINRLTIANTGHGTQILQMGERTVEVSGTADVDEIERALSNPFIPGTIRMSVIDRIKQKALQAKTVAPDAIKQFEADLDDIIAEKAVIEERRTAAVSPHKEAIAGVKGEIDGLKSAIDILSND